jgi:hypothetical protein
MTREIDTPTWIQETLTESASRGHEPCYADGQEVGMPKPFKQWTVLPHRKLTRLDERLLTVVGDLHMPFGDFPRRMTIVRLLDSRLVIFSAIALHEDEMQLIEAAGKPAYLVVPNDIHRMDAKIWKDRYPEMIVLAPAGVREKVEEVVPVDLTTVDFGDPGVRFVTVDGTRAREAALEVETASGTTLVLNDLIWNMRSRPGFAGWLFKVLGMTGNEPRIPFVVERREVKDRSLLRAQLEAWASMRGLNRIIVSHGSIVTRDPSGVLSHLAHDLAA